VEPIYGVPTQRYVDAYEGKGLAKLLDDIAEIARKRGGGQPSLLQDVIKKRRTEIDYLNGYVVEQGRAAGVPTPFNEAVARLFHEHGPRFTPDPQNLAPLVRMLP
jgi:2-dehydropantoate 2-reductase